MRSALPFDHEAKPAHTVLLRATDTGGMTYDKAVVVAVTDANDPPAIEPPGDVLSAKSASLAVNRRYAVVLDLLADGRVNVSVDGVRRHTFKFVSPAAGQVGLAADLARSYFDDVTVWTPAMLSP